MTAELRVGVDVGGTFTDVVSVDPDSGSLIHAKALTTHPDRHRASSLPFPSWVAATTAISASARRWRPIRC